MANIATFTESFDIPESAGLDRISVFLTDYGVGRGMVTLVCYGNAWSSYFGGMGEKRIEEFVRMAGRDYLVNKLGISQVLAQRKRDLVYLGRVIDAVKAELADRPMSEVIAAS